MVFMYVNLTNLVWESHSGGHIGNHCTGTLSFKSSHCDIFEEQEAVSMYKDTILPEEEFPLLR